MINYRTMMPLGSDKIESVYDYLIWFAADIDKMKYINVTVPKAVGGDSEFVLAEGEGGAIDNPPNLSLSPCKSEKDEV